MTAERHAPCVYLCPSKGATCVPYDGFDYDTAKPYRKPWTMSCYKGDDECGWAWELVDGEWKSVPTGTGKRRGRR